MQPDSGAQRLGFVDFKGGNVDISFFRLTASLALLGSLLGTPGQSAPTQGNNPGVREMPLTAYGSSRPLRSYQTRNRATPVINKTVRTHRPTSQIASRRPTVQLPDALRQESAEPSGQQLTPTSSGFPGLGDDENASIAGVRVVPADTQGDVGPDHYIQMINVIYAIYDKDTGAIVPGGGPFPNNALWEGFGGPCEFQNDGDPIVLYDHLADRWVFSQFAVPGYQCFAVSKTNDPLGEYHLYQYLVSPGFLGLFPDINDYPKIGVWPDAYYMSFNEFSGLTGDYQGVVVAAFERQKMLDGLVAQGIREGPLQCNTECYFAVQPSHLEGPAPPPGTPNTFVMAFDDQAWGTGTGTDGYRLWDFSVNWNDALTSTFTPQPQADTTAFNAVLCGGARDCIPQPAPGERVDSLSVFTMYRAQYRNFGTHQTLVLNHTVDAGGGVAGVRWAELRKTGSETDWSVFQTGTYAPNDDVHRWTGSIAMDGAGNIGLGYSASSETLMPSIRYTSRTASDPPGVMAGGEQTMVAGDAYQTASSNRWGDYASMSIDPVDDCTFWFTQEYQGDDLDGQTDFDFKTWIGAFTLPNCGSGALQAPVVTITSPAHGSSSTEGQPVTFEASASDPEDDPVDPDEIEWTSSMVGAIGTGPSFVLSDLPAGTHIITAAFTDSDGMSGSDDVTITITPAGGGGAVHVASVESGTRNVGQGSKVGTATVVIHDESGSPIAGALVSGDFLGTFAGESGAATTDTNGVAYFETASTARRGVSVEFCVTNVAGFTYDATSNIVTCSFDTPGGPTVTITLPAVDPFTSGQGDPIDFTATATDASNADISDSIVWTDDTVLLGSAASITTSSLSVGTHTITATATDSGGLSGTDQIVVEIVGGGAATTMHVSSVVTGTINIGQGRKRGAATVTVVNDLGNPVIGAEVTGNFSGTITEAGATGTTGQPDGTTTIVTSATARGGVSVSFCVSDVVASGLTYLPGSSTGVCPP